jgi:hypothetical protein
MNDSWQSLKNLIATPDLPELGPTPRSGRLPMRDLAQKIDRFLAQTQLPPAIHSSIRAAALLWHDYLDDSHALSQNISGADGSFLHGIMHRREPDYANAKYWFRRVGRHSSFADIAKQVARRLQSAGEPELAAKLTPRGVWDPFAFVDACQAAVEGPLPDEQIQTLRAIQEIEFDCLLAHLSAR